MAIPFHRPMISPLVVGRAPHLAALRAAHLAAKHGGQTIVVSGEAGIGKTRLVAEALTADAAETTLVLRGDCYESDRAAPYAPVVEILRTLIAHHSLRSVAEQLGPLAHDLAVLLPELATVLPDGTSAPGDPEQRKRRLWHALLTWFAQVAAVAPLVIVFEDLHWSDDATLEFFRFAARRIAPHQILLIATYRSDEASPTLTRVLGDLARERLATELALAPLAPADIDAMVQAIFDLRRPVQTDFLAALATVTEGNPFYIEETLKALAASGDVLYADVIRDHTALAALRVPQTVHDLVARRAGHLGRGARETLDVASVIGRRFDFALLQAIRGGGEGSLLAQIKELVASNLIVEEGAERFAFRHALTQRAIAAQLLTRERRAWHRRIAAVLEGWRGIRDIPDAELAHHYYEAEVWTRARAYAQSAAARAIALAEPRAAIVQWTYALEAARHLGEAAPAAIYRARGQAHEMVGAFAAARADYERTIAVGEAAGDRRAIWQSLIDLGLLWSGHDYDRASEYFARASTLAEEIDDDRLRAQSLNRLGNLLVNTRDVAAGLRAHDEALGLLAATDDQAGIAETHDLIGIASWHGGDMIAAVDRLGEAIAGYRASGNTYGLVTALASRCGGASPAMADTSYSALRTPDACGRDGEEALDLARRIDWPAGQAYAAVQRGAAAAAFGQFRDALRYGQRALDIAVEIEHRQWTVAAHYSLGTTYALLLDTGAASRHLEAALALAHVLRSPWWIGIVGAALVSASLAASDLARADAALSAVCAELPRPHPANGRRFRWLAGELALARRRPLIALEYADELLTSAPGGPHAQPIPTLHRLRGLALLALRRPEEAVEALNAAKRGAEERGQRPLLWRVQVSFGDSYRALQRHTEAREAYAASRIEIAALVEGIKDETLRDRFVSAALATMPKERPPSAHRVTKAASGGLTPRERDVAVLVATGKSNQEIGAALFIGEGTVATHVGNILSKLHLDSRTQIAAWAIERGLHSSD